MTATLGARRPRDRRRRGAPGRTSSRTSTTSSSRRPAQERLAAELVGVAPAGLDRVHFVTGGAEANETALRLAYHYHVERGEPGPHPHRLPGAGLPRPDDGHARADGPARAVGAVRAVRHAAACTSRRRRGASTRAAQGALDALDAHIDDARRGLHRGLLLRADLAPPRCPPTRRRTRSGTASPSAASEHGFLIVLDEVVTGMGRTGTWFASDALPLVPDIVTTAKGLGAGYGRDRRGAVRRSTSTRRSRPARAPSSTATPGTARRCPCAVGLAVIDSPARATGWWSGCASTARALRDAIADALADCELVREVRGRGFLLGVEYVDPRDGESFLDPDLRRRPPHRRGGAGARAAALLDAADARRLRRRPDAARPGVRDARGGAGADRRAARRHRRRRRGAGEGASSPAPALRARDGGIRCGDGDRAARRADRPRAAADRRPPSRRRGDAAGDGRRRRRPARAGRRPALQRDYGDVDLAAPRRARREVEDPMTAAGLEPEREFNALHGGGRQIWWMPATARRHVDVFLGEFRMCHRLDLEPGARAAGAGAARRRPAADEAPGGRAQPRRTCRTPPRCSRPTSWRRTGRSRSTGCATCSPPTGASTRPRPTTSERLPGRPRRSPRASPLPSPRRAGRYRERARSARPRAPRSACARRSGACASAGTSSGGDGGLGPLDPRQPGRAALRREPRLDPVRSIEATRQPPPANAARSSSSLTGCGPGRGRRREAEHVQVPPGRVTAARPATYSRRSSPSNVWNSPQSSTVSNARPSRSRCSASATANSAATPRRRPSPVPSPPPSRPRRRRGRPPERGDVEQRSQPVPQPRRGPRRRTRPCPPRGRSRCGSAGDVQGAGPSCRTRPRLAGLRSWLVGGAAAVSILRAHTWP